MTAASTRDKVTRLRDDGRGDEVTLMMVGDVNIQKRSDPAGAFAGVSETLRQADVLFGQLEGPLSAPSSDPSHPDIPHKAGWQHSDPEMVEGLVAAGFSAVSCASNVTYGERAALDTLDTLDTAKIERCGVGRNLAEAHLPAIVERGGVRFGFLSYTSVFWPIGHAAGPDTPGVATIKATTAYQPGPRTLEMPGTPPIVVTNPDPDELARMEEDVRGLREQVDILVASCHWGVAGSEEVADYQRIIGRAAIDAGADLVLGHHPHVLQEVEVWEGCPIFYSTGNFAFDWDEMRGKDLDGILVHCVVRDRKLEGVSFVPARRNDENLIELLALDGEPGREIVERVRNLSASSGTRLTVTGEEVMLDGIGVH